MGGLLLALWWVAFIACWVGVFFIICMIGAYKKEKDAAAWRKHRAERRQWWDNYWRTTHMTHAQCTPSRRVMTHSLASSTSVPGSMPGWHEWQPAQPDRLDVTKEFEQLPIKIDAEQEV